MATESQKSLSKVKSELEEFCKMNVDQLDGNKDRISECIALLCMQVENTELGIEETAFKATKLFLVRMMISCTCIRVAIFVFVCRFSWRSIGRFTGRMTQSKRSF